MYLGEPTGSLSLRRRFAMWTSTARPSGGRSSHREARLELGSDRVLRDTRRLPFISVSSRSNSLRVSPTAWSATVHSHRSGLIWSPLWLSHDDSSICSHGGPGGVAPSTLVTPGRLGSMVLRLERRSIASTRARASRGRKGLGEVVISAYVNPINVSISSSRAVSMIT